MELDSEDRPSPVGDCHDHAVARLRVDGQLARDGGAIDGQRVVSRRTHRRRTSDEQPLPAVQDLADFSVHRHARPPDVRAERFADRLMAQADAEERNVAVGANKLDDTSGAHGRAGTGRDDDRLRFFREQILGIEGIIAHNAHRAPREAFDLLH